VNEPATDAGVYVPEAGKVAIRDLDGSVSLVRQVDLPAAQNEGARPATQAEYFGAKHGAAGEVAAATVGAARGATFGAFDPAFLAATGALAGDQQAEEYRNTLRLLKQANPNATVGGEFAGAIVPSLVTGGGGQAVGTLGEGAIARFGARALAAAPRAVGEGVAMGLGAQLSEDTLENHKMVGEAYLSAGVKGGALGLLLGAGGAGVLGHAGDKAGALFGRGERGVLQAESGMASRLARAEEGAPYRAAGVRAEESAAEAGTRKSLLTRAEELGNEQAYKATGANQTDWKRLGADVEGRAAEAQRIGKMLQAETVEGKALVEATASQAEIARRITAKQQEVAKGFAPMYAEADRAAARPSMSAIRESMGELRAKHAGTMFGDSEIRGAEDTFSRLEKSLGENPTTSKLWEARREIDGRLSKFYARDKISGLVPEGEGAMRDLRGLVNNELTASVERASKELGGTLGDRLRSANALYGDLSTAKLAASRAASRIDGNMAVSITDVIAGASGGVAGMAAMGANMVRRKYGNQIAAHVLGTATKMDTVQRAATKLDELINAGSKAFVSNGKTATRAAKSVSSAEIRAAREATRNPEAVTARMTEHLGDMQEYAPKVAAEIAATGARAAAWMQHALPKEAQPLTPSFGKSKPAEYSDTDRLKARAIMETVADGSIVIDRLRDGSLTDAHVATLKFVHPETYAKIRTYLGQHATELQATMNQQQLFRLGLLFGEPLTEAALPANIRAFQASFTQGNQAPGPGGAGGKVPMMNSKPVMGGGSSATQFDRVEKGSQ
jgi:hypothetical protein